MAKRKKKKKKKRAFKVDVLFWLQLISTEIRFAFFHSPDFHCSTINDFYLDFKRYGKPNHNLIVADFSFELRHNAATKWDECKRVSECSVDWSTANGLMKKLPATFMASFNLFFYAKDDHVLIFIWLLSGRKKIIACQKM